MVDRRNVSGGGAGASGYDYQAEAYTLIAAKMLARESLPWADTGCNRVPIAIQMETGTGGDDLRIQLEAGSVVEIQAKRGLQRGAHLWEALMHLARAISGENQVHGVLLINEAASGTIGSALRQAIPRVGQGRTDGLPGIASEFVERLVAAQFDPVEICSRLRIIVRDFDQGASGEQETLTAIGVIVSDDSQVGAARGVLVADGLDLTAIRGATDGVRLARLLRQNGIPLSTTASNPVILREAYLDWMVRSNDSILIPTLNARLPISSAWVRLRAMSMDGDLENAPKSLDQQIANYHEWHRLAERQRDQHTFDIEVAAKRERFLVIVGGPGTGKSTLLRRCAHSLSIAGQLALRVSLRAVSQLLDQGMTFADAIILVASDGFASTSNTAAQMLHEAQILLADGLDEADPNRAHVAEMLRKWAEASPDRKVIATTRPIGHEPAWFESWKHLELLPLGTEDIENYAAQVFGLLFRDKAEAESWSEGFVESLKNSRTATIAARNPQLLGFLIALHVGGAKITGKRSNIFGSIFELSRTQSHADRRFRKVVEQAIAYRALEFIGWTLLSEPTIPTRDLVERIGDLFEQETGKPRLAAQELAEQALEFWVERGILERIGMGLQTTVTFVHMNLRDYAVAQYLRSMGESEFVSWLLMCYKDPQFREVILLTGGTDQLGLTVKTLLEIDTPDDQVSTLALLAGDVLGEAEDPPSSTTLAVVERLSPRLESSVPMVTYETGDRLRLLATVAPELIGPLALQLQCHSQLWTKEVACALGLLASAERYVDETVLLEIYGSTDDSARIGKRRSKGWDVSVNPISKELVLLGAEYLVQEGHSEECLEAVKEKYRRGQHSLGTQDALRGILARRLDQATLHELRPEYYEAMNSFWIGPGTRRREFESLRVFLEAIARACAKSTSGRSTRESNPVRNAIARIYTLLEIDDAPMDEVFAIGEHGLDDALIEVMRGVISVGELDFAEVQAEAEQTLADLEPPIPDRHDYFPNLKFRSLIQDSEEITYPFQPNWQRCVSQHLDPWLLMKALEHPCLNIALFAWNLLWSCCDRFLLASELKDLLAHGKGYTLAILAQAAPELWPNEAHDLILDRLESSADDDCAPLIRALFHVQKADSDARIKAVLTNLLEVREVQVVSAAADVIREMEYEYDFRDNIFECYRWWLRDGPQDPGPEDKVRVIPSSPAAAMLAQLSRIGRATLSDLEEACSSSRSDVREVGVEQIACMLEARGELTTGILAKINTGHLPSGILDELSRIHPQVCQAHESGIIDLLNSPELYVQLSVIRALGDGWCNRETATALLHTLLHHEDIGTRDVVMKVLRRLRNEP